MSSLVSIDFSISEADDPVLLTPGPLSTSLSVKKAMLKDWGSWDEDFRQITSNICNRLLAICGADEENYVCVPMQGSGTFAVEAMLGTFVPNDGKVLVLANGAYGLRAAKILKTIGRKTHILDKGDYLPPRGSEVEEILRQDKEITHVVAIHCETSSGILNPLKEIASVCRRFGIKLLVDGMSAFGGVPFDMQKIDCEAIVSSANKCLEGVPGFSFIICKKAELSKTSDNCHSLSLDIFDQWQYLEKTGQWRFTPPTHVVAAFSQALDEFDAEGGLSARGLRYSKNRDVLVQGMREIGFETLLDDQWLSPIIVTFFNPHDRNFDFTKFYQAMKSKGFIIYPGKLTLVDSFRIGCIGRISENTMAEVVVAAKESLQELNVTSAAPPIVALEERQKLACG